MNTTQLKQDDTGTTLAHLAFGSRQFRLQLLFEMMRLRSQTCSEK